MGSGNNSSCDGDNCGMPWAAGNLPPFQQEKGRMIFSTMESDNGPPEAAARRREIDGTGCRRCNGPRQDSKLAPMRRLDPETASRGQ